MLQTVMREALATFTGKRASESLPAPSWKYASTQCPWMLALHHRLSQRDVAIMLYIYVYIWFYTLKGS